MRDNHQFIFKINGHDFKFTPKDIANPEDMNPEGDYNPHNLHTFILHEEGYVQAVVFASNLQDAMDEAVDANLLDKFMVTPEEINDYKCDKHEEYDFNCGECESGITYLGNAGEPFDTENLSAIEITCAEWTQEYWTLDQLDAAIDVLEERYESSNEGWREENKQRYLSYCAARANLFWE